MDYQAIYDKLMRIVNNTDTTCEAMKPQVFRDFLTIIDRAQKIVRLEAEQAGKIIL